MTSRIAVLLSVICFVVFPSMTLAQARTTPVEVQNTPTVAISPSNNLVQTQVKTLKVQPLTSALTVPASSSAFIPSVSCAGYKEARVVVFSNITYTVAQNLTLTFQFDNIAVGLMPWYAGASTPNGCGLSPICTSFVAVVPVVGDTLEIRITNGNAGSITINPSSCWVYLVN